MRVALGFPFTVIVTLSIFLFTFVTISGKFARACDIEIKSLIFKYVQHYVQLVKEKKLGLRDEKHPNKLVRARELR